MIENLDKENLFVIYKCISECLKLSRLYMANKCHSQEDEIKDLIKTNINSILILKRTNKFKFMERYLEQSIILRTIEVSTREEADFLRYLGYKLFEEYPSNSDFTMVTCILSELKKILDKHTYPKKFLKDLTNIKENHIKNYGFKYFSKLNLSHKSNSLDSPRILLHGLRQSLPPIISIYDLFMIYLPEYHQLHKDTYDTLMGDDDIIPLSWKYYLAITVFILIFRLFPYSRTNTLIPT